MNENPKLWEGRVIDGRFPLLLYLGGGDRSAVFATVNDDGSFPSAAIKLVEANPEDAEAQLAGWAAATALSHPHLMRVFQTGRCQLDGAEFIFLVMERADEDLSQVLPLRPLSAAETSEAMASILDALAYLHALGLVHTRLRPANILAAGDQLKISSDRLCRAGEARVRRQKPDAYDAPEAAQGEIMPAADVWSLGVTLVEALTQSKKPERALPLLPAPFGDIARHCLQPDPLRRWTVPEIQARLRQPSPAPRVESAARPATRARAWQGLLAATLTLVLVLAAVLAVPRLVNRRAEQRTPPAFPVQAESARPEPEPTSTPERAAKPSSSEASPARSATPAPSPFPTPSPTPPVEASPPPAQGPVAGRVLEQVLPEVPPQARGSIHGTVKVDVKVSAGPTGSVERAHLASEGSSRYFAGLAVEAARQWRFSPPTVDGQAVASEWLLHFEFDSSATTVHLERLAP
jgi:TonB family protein